MLRSGVWGSVFVGEKCAGDLQNCSEGKMVQGKRLVKRGLGMFSVVVAAAGLTASSASAAVLAFDNFEAGTHPGAIAVEGAGCHIERAGTDDAAAVA